MVAINPAQELFAAFFTIYFTLTIDRSFKEYRPYDTYAAWQGDPFALRRTFLAWTTLIILPLLQFALIIGLLSGVELSFDHSLTDILAIMTIGILSFFEFGYYRIFEAIVHLRPQIFYSEDDKETISEERREFWSHFIPGALYLVISAVLFLLVLLLQNP